MSTGPRGTPELAVAPVNYASRFSLINVLTIFFSNASGMGFSAVKRSVPFPEK
jgi:hypothetical protein